MGCIIHKWNEAGCKCTKCGKVRPERHIWNGCTCSACGATIDAGHDWNFCTCKICGKIGNTKEYRHLNSWETVEIHDWQIDPSTCDKEECSVCGKRKESKQRHQWKLLPEECEKWRCQKCGEISGRTMAFSPSFDDSHHLEQCVCTVCGRKREHNPYNASENYWENIGNCRMRCKRCGIVYYNHDYQGIGQFSVTEFRCSNCGHVGHHAQGELGGTSSLERGEVKTNS